MGLTGVITRGDAAGASRSRPALRRGRHRAHRRPRRADGADAATHDDDHRYSVAWIDTLARGSVARPVGADSRRPRDRAPSCTGAAVRRPAGAPAATPARASRSRAPAGLMTALDRARLQRAVVPQGPAATASASRSRSRRSSTRSTGRRAGTGSTARAGFVQYQFVVPDARRGRADRARSSRLRAAGHPSFLSVLKRFGAGQPRAAVLPDAGLDARARPPGRAGARPAVPTRSTGSWSRPAGGSTWPRTRGSRPGPSTRCTRGSTTSASSRRELDPDGVLQSDLARRLDL